MQTKRFLRGALLTGVWSYAAATWAGIAHHLLGMPDLVPIAAVVAALAAAGWSFRRPTKRPSAGIVALQDPAPVAK